MVKNNDEMNIVFSKRLREAMEERNMKQVDLTKATGIGKSAISQYLSGSFIPKNDKIYLLSKALYVEPNWLLGLEVEKKKSSAIEDLIENQKMINFLKNYEKLSDEDKRQVDKMVDFLLYNNDK
jgi:transcriptional regulator with XRE-family HTH domain